MDEILQWTAVAIILIIAVIYIVRKMSRKNDRCASCGLNGRCTESKCDGTADDNTYKNKITDK